MISISSKYLLHCSRYKPKATSLLTNYRMFSFSSSKNEKKVKDSIKKENKELEEQKLKQEETKMEKVQFLSKLLFIKNSTEYY